MVIQTREEGRIYYSFALFSLAQKIAESRWEGLSSGVKLGLSQMAANRCAMYCISFGFAGFSILLWSLRVLPRSPEGECRERACACTGRRSTSRVYGCRFVPYRVSAAAL